MSIWILAHGAPFGKSLRFVACRYLILVCCEGGENLFFLLPRHFDEVQGAPKFGGDLVEFFGRDLETTMGLFKTQGRFAIRAKSRRIRGAAPLSRCQSQVFADP